MKVRLQSGEEALALRYADGTMALRSPKAFAPGSPIHLSFVVGDASRTLEGRTIGSKRLDEAAFEVRLRLVNLRRAEREALVAALGDGD